MTVYFGELLKIAFVDKLICKMLKKKLKGEIRNQHYDNLQIILDCLPYIHLTPKNGYRNVNPVYLIDMCSN